MTDSNHDLARRFMRIAKSVQNRRPLDDDKPNGYLESDRDYLANNNREAVELLDLAVEMIERRK